MQYETSKHEQGTALILTVVMMVLIMGLMVGMIMLNMTFSDDQTRQSNYDQSLHRSEMIIAHALRTIHDFPGFGIEVSQDRLIGLVVIQQAVVQQWRGDIGSSAIGRPKDLFGAGDVTGLRQWNRHR